MWEHVTKKNIKESKMLSLSDGQTYGSTDTGNYRKGFTLQKERIFVLTEFTSWRKSSTRLLSEPSSPSRNLSWKRIKTPTCTKKCGQNSPSQFYTLCPRSCDPFYIVSYYIKWVTTYFLDTQYAVINLLLLIKTYSIVIVVIPPGDILRHFMTSDLNYDKLKFLSNMFKFPSKFYFIN